MGDQARNTVNGTVPAGRGYDYLTREVATSKHDYYTGKGEAAGVWSGRGATVLGLSGDVNADDMAVLYGRFVVPSTAGGTRLPSGRWESEQVLGRKVVAKTRVGGSVAEPIAAFDVTFSPSKSVSVLWGLTDDERVRETVLEAHEAAVAAGLGVSRSSSRTHTRRRRRGPQDRQLRVRHRPVPSPLIALDGPRDAGR